MIKNIFETKKIDATEEVVLSTATADDFFDGHERALEDYAESTGITFRRGQGWAINVAKGEATYDPAFFADKGYTSAESMWAACHEVEHFRNWRLDPESYARLFGRMQSRRRIHLLYNCLDDIMVGRETDRRFPAHIATREGLYREKLFPGIDYTAKPKHLQFAYALLREKMLDEKLQIASEVRAEVERLKDIDRKGTDLVDLVSDPTAPPEQRFKVIRDYIEPIFERFYQEDLEERKKKQEQGKGGQEGEPGDGDEPDAEGESSDSGKPSKEGQPKGGEANFADEYDEFDEKMGRPLPLEDIKDALDKASKEQAVAKQTSEKRAEAQFEREHGVSTKELANYRQDYLKVEKYIAPLRELFERIISTRKEIRRRLKERTDQGVVLDPSLAAQAYIDMQSGVLDSRTQLKVRKEARDEHKPNNLEFTLVCDLSGSMDENQPGGKSYEQRLCAILIMEALDEFEEKLHAERLDRTLDLQIFTEVRGFGEDDEILKPMNDDIKHQDRLKVAKRLASCAAGSTADYKTLAAIDKNVDQMAAQKIFKGDLKKIVLLITDGGSDDVRQVKKEKKFLQESGVAIKAIQIGSPSEGDREKFKEVWQAGGDGVHCPEVSKLVQTVEKLLAEFLKDL